MCEMQLKWFEHVKRTSIRTPMKRTDGMEQVCSKGFKGRQKYVKLLGMTWNIMALQTIWHR